MSWERYKKYYLGLENLGFGLDVSRVGFDDAFLASMQEPAKEAFASMVALEAGAIANPDENRMVATIGSARRELGAHSRNQGGD